MNSSLCDSADERCEDEIPSGWEPKWPTRNVTRFVYPFCEAVISRDLLRPPSFKAPVRLKQTNNIAMRFGGSNDMITLLEGTPEEQEAYLKGLVASSVLVAAFFLLLCFLMLVFKCSGKRYFGFFCGRFIRPSPPPLSVAPLDASKAARVGASGSAVHEAQSQDQESIYLVDVPPSPGGSNGPGGVDPLSSSEAEDEPHDQFAKPPAVNINTEPSKDAYQEWVTFCDRQKVRHWRVRFVVVFSCLGIITSSILFCYYGKKYFVQTVESVEEGLGQIQGLLVGGMDLVSSIEAQQQAAAERFNASFSEMNGICPKAREQLCLVTEPTIQNCSFTDIPVVNETLSELFSFVYTTRTYIMEELDGARSDLQESYDEIQALLDAESNTDWLFWAAFSFCLALSLCCVGLMWGVCCRQSCQLKCCRRRILLPLFCMLVVCASLFCILFLIAAVGASDWCINSPDSKVSYIIEKLSEKEPSVIFGFAYYYVNRCNTGQPPEISDQMTTLIEVLTAVAAFSEALQGMSSDTWNEACGKDSSSIQNFGKLVEDLTCGLINILQEFSQFMWCRNWTPMYLTLMDDAICDNAQVGMAWLASTTFVMVTLSLVVFLCRAGAFEIEDETKYRRLSDRYHQCCYSFAMSMCGPRQKKLCNNLGYKMAMAIFGPPKQNPPPPVEQSPSSVQGIIGFDDERQDNNDAAHAAQSYYANNQESPRRVSSSSRNNIESFQDEHDHQQASSAGDYTETSENNEHNQRASSSAGDHTESFDNEHNQEVQGYSDDQQQQRQQQQLYDDENQPYNEDQHEHPYYEDQQQPYHENDADHHHHSDRDDVGQQEYFQSEPRRSPATSARESSEH